MSNRDTVYFLCGSLTENPNYCSWIDRLARPYIVVDHLPSDWSPPEDAALVITHNQYRHAEVSAIRRSIEDQTPTLILADGILEYRNSWENPALPEGAIFSPVCGHKLACIGDAQARWVSSWGNAGKCEVVGLPRLDDCPVERSVPPEPSRPFRILIVTARSPGFTDSQLRNTRQSLDDLNRWFKSHQELQGRQVEPIWRISPEIATELDIQMDSFNMFGNGLVDAIGHVDAVLTTPSTSMLEAMRMGRPTALIDYHHCPLYVPAAWTLTHREQISAVVEELLDPPQTKMAFQREILRDNLQSEVPAVDRMIELVEQMVQIGNECRAANRPLSLPERILPTTSCAPLTPRQTSSASSSEPLTGQDETLLRQLRIELQHADVQIRDQQAAIRENQADVRKAERRIERRQQRIRVLVQKELSQNRDGRVAVRRQARSDAKLAQARTRHQSNKKRLQLKGRAVERLKQRQKKHLHLLEKRKRQLARLQNRVTSLARRRKRLLELIENSHAKQQMLGAQIGVLSSELQSLHEHWLIGRVIRLANRFGKDKSESKANSQ